MALKSVTACLAAAIALAAPAAPYADTQTVTAKRLTSCHAGSFDPVFENGAQVGYRHKRFQIEGKTYVGGAVLEWCLPAQNTIIYFYVDDPMSGDDKNNPCPENMSFAVFPGRGAEVAKILEDNALSFYNPNVELIEKPTTGPIQIAAHGRTIAAIQLTGVVIDSAGRPTRKKMIGYNKDGAFVRVMTGTVENGSCKNQTSETFMQALDWP